MPKINTFMIKLLSRNQLIISVCLKHTRMLKMVKCFLLLQLLVVSKAYQNSTRSKRWLNDNACGAADSATPLIYGGMTFTRGAWPYMAALFHRDTSGSMKFICGGVIVSRTQIITGSRTFFLISETSLLIFFCLSCPLHKKQG